MLYPSSCQSFLCCSNHLGISSCLRFFHSCCKAAYLAVICPIDAAAPSFTAFNAFCSAVSRLNRLLIPDTILSQFLSIIKPTSTSVCQLIRVRPNFLPTLSTLPNCSAYSAVPFVMVARLALISAWSFLKAFSWSRNIGMLFEIAKKNWLRLSADGASLNICWNE